MLQVYGFACVPLPGGRPGDGKGGGNGREREAFAPTLPLSHIDWLLRLQMEEFTKYFFEMLKIMILLSIIPTKIVQTDVVIIGYQF